MVRGKWINRGVENSGLKRTHELRFPIRSGCIAKHPQSSRTENLETQNSKGAKFNRRESSKGLCLLNLKLHLLEKIMRNHVVLFTISLVKNLAFLIVFLGLDPMTVMGRRKQRDGHTACCFRNCRAHPNFYQLSFSST